MSFIEIKTTTVYNDRFPSPYGAWVSSKTRQSEFLKLFPFPSPYEAWVSSEKIMIMKEKSSKSFRPLTGHGFHLL